MEENINGESESFVSRLFCIHRTFKSLKSKVETFAEVTHLIPPEDESFYQKVQKDIKVVCFCVIKSFSGIWSCVFS